MPLNLRPHRGLIVLLLFFGLTLLTPLAAHKKRKATEEETKSKSKAKPLQKIDPKQLAKTARDSRKEEERHKKQLAQKKKDEDKEEKKRSKQLGKLAAKQREEKTNDKSPGKDKTAKREADKKNDKAKDKLAKRDAEKKNDKADKIKDKLAKREDDKKSGKKELAAKKSPPEKDTKRSKVAKETELAEAKTKVKAEQQNSKAKPEEKREELAKQVKVASNAKHLIKSDRKQEPEDKIKVLPPSKFTLRPVAKALSKIELKFTVARAVALTSFDAPPPRETAPDVIDVIEHNSQDAKRLDDLVRSEMKSPQFSSVPNISHKKLDVGKMEGERIRQIQEALAKKGYYSGEISGQYGEATIEAMRKFQEEHRVDVTGYATAQSLKLLGLTDW